MTDWRKLLVDEHLWDYRCKAVPVPLVREIVEEVETLRQDLAAARAERDAAFKMSRCECSADECCSNLVRLHNDLAAARALLDQCQPHIRGNVGAWEQIRPKLGPHGQRSTDHAIAEGRALLVAIDTALGGK